MRKWELKLELKHARKEIEFLKDRISELRDENEILNNAELFMPGQLKVAHLPEFDRDTAWPWNEMG